MQGYYCPQGTSFDVPACPKGTYQDLEKATELSDCKSCDAGKYCGEEHLDAPSGLSALTGYTCNRNNCILNDLFAVDGMCGWSEHLEFWQ